MIRGGGDKKGLGKEVEKHKVVDRTGLGVVVFEKRCSAAVSAGRRECTVMIELERRYSFGVCWEHLFCGTSRLASSSLRYSVQKDFDLS